ncbi:hypothetical protein phiK7A1_134 [Pseudomonas phage phiK7A1]|uniref:Uncharacterized protein n=1 Tax=Pseudomonas phage phiK7A1 TaxID=2759194 RepID=A0A7H0XFY2_9CAUD|nr:hypothetical protein phiK7A1_134 [Pseudomonas phage phiK7A1]
MINYAQKETHIAVKWKKTEIGRITKVGRSYVYVPRGTGGAIQSEPMNSVGAVKQHIEKEKLAIHFFYG